MVDAAMLQRLVEAAREARRHVHAPYSKFAVGAALLETAHHYARRVVAVELRACASAMK